MVVIDQRPAEVENRLVAGHWEGDLIVGRGHGSAIGTLAERASGYMVLVHLPTGHTAPVVFEALTEVMSALPGALKLSLTWDQGVEMGAHHLFTQATGILVCFCRCMAAGTWTRWRRSPTPGRARRWAGRPRPSVWRSSRRRRSRHRPQRASPLKVPRHR